ncbi:DUF732 domain-containing protein [Mycobacterium sp. HUMS_1102779]|uniref:DUF732 domain-containing protein n=1 Tax=Mycobacterium sp. HUMS_1102779 TaxID=3383487 RepID=UPI00389A4A0B
MAHSRAITARWSTLVAAPLAALLFAVPAAADQVDDAFVAALQKRGIVFPSDAAAIAAARNVCAGLDNGQTPAGLTLALAKTTFLSARDAGYFIGASVASYCPQYRSDAGISVPPTAG